MIFFFFCNLQHLALLSSAFSEIHKKKKNSLFILIFVLFLGFFLYWGEIAMRNSFLFFSLIAFFIAYLQFQVHAAAPAGKIQFSDLIFFFVVDVDWDKFCMI